MKALLLILDGAGLAPPHPGNAVTEETMPTLFRAMAEHGHATLGASGPPVGLDDGQVGNSEVGHLTIGAGHVIPSTLSRIDQAHADGTWARSALWDRLGETPRLHVVGLLSDAGVHGHLRSLARAALLASRHGIAEVIVHPVLDGNDSQAGTAPALLDRLRAELADSPAIRLGLVIGRRWFTDRGGDLTVTRVFTDALANRGDLPEFGEAALARHLETATEATFPPHLAPGGRLAEAGEPVLLTQHRADRAIQTAQVLAERHPVWSLVELGSATPESQVFFPATPLSRGLAFELKRGDLRSTRIAEACKFPHVTRFMNGLNAGLEGRAIRVDSIADAEIPNHPEMSIDEVARQIEAVVRDPANRVAIANIANLDQVGHLGRYDLAVRAARCVDDTLAKLLGICAEEGWTVLITSDHGNADRTQDEAGRPFGSHTDRPVPFTVVPAPGTAFSWRSDTGSLANVAPSLLSVLGLPRAAYMEPSLIEAAG
jgi:2,3-bisphosphoglycerate-independent phosphoglycerate mutase